MAATLLVFGSWAVIGGLLAGPEHTFLLKQVHAWMVATPVEQVLVQSHAMFISAAWACVKIGLLLGFGQKLLALVAHSVEGQAAFPCSDLAPNPSNEVDVKMRCNKRFKKEDLNKKKNLLSENDSWFRDRNHRNMLMLESLPNETLSTLIEIWRGYRVEDEREAYERFINNETYRLKSCSPKSDAQRIATDTGIELRFCLAFAEIMFPGLQCQCPRCKALVKRFEKE